jgi:hypothetical protein
MSSAVAPEEQLEWEARAARPAGMAAIASAVLLLLASFYPVIWGHTEIPYAGQYFGYAQHPADVFVPFGFQAASELLLVLPFLYLIRVIRARTDQMSKALSYVAIAGPVIAAIVVVLVMFATHGVANKFADTNPVLTPTTAQLAEVPATVGSATGAYSAVREKAEIKVYDLRKHDGFYTTTAFLSLAANLAFGFAFILIGLNGMRVGIFSRVIGIFGIIIGVLSVLFQGAGILQAFWLGAMGALVLGFWPSGRGPAWDTVEAIPWPSAARARQEAMEEARAGGGEEPAEADLDDEDYDEDVVESPGGEPEVVEHARSRKRKRKRRR